MPKKQLTKKSPCEDWSQSYGNTWDDSSQGAELYDGFISAAVAEAITEDAAWYCWHASRRQAMLEACWQKAGAFVHQQIIWVKDRGVLTRPPPVGWLQFTRRLRRLRVSTTSETPPCTPWQRTDSE